MTLPLEYCSECGDPTGHAGRADDSLFTERDGREVGPLCDDCYKTLKVAESDDYE